MDINRIKEDIDTLMKDKNLYLYSIKYENSILEVVFDKDGFIDSDEIIECTNIVNEYLDKTDPIKEEYSLEVTSRGIEKDITFDKCEYYLKEYVEVESYSQVFRGELVEKGKDYIVINDSKNKKINIKANDIVSINIKVKF